jgi:hypothetical protein
VNKSAGDVPLVPPGVVTTTSTVPTVPGGATAEIVNALITLTEPDGVAPNVTLAGEAKLDPLMITVSPPARGPLVGERDVTVGGDK